VADPKGTQTPPAAPPAGPPAPPATPPAPAAGSGVEDTIRRVVTEMLEKFKPSGGGAASEHDVSAQVEAAVQKVHRGQRAEQVMADLETRLKAIESKPAPEKKPKEYRKITTRLWGDDDDD